MTWPFENDTRAIVKKLAKRSLATDRSRNLVALITIGLCVCLMALFAFLDTAMNEQTLERIRGQYQSGCQNLSYADIDRLVSAGKFEQWGYQSSTESIRYRDANLYVQFYDEGMRTLMSTAAVSGEYPRQENEICVEREFLKYFSLPEETGQTLSINLGYGSQTYVISGILEKGNASRSFYVYISEALAASQSDKPFTLRFRLAGSDAGRPEQLQADIEAFYREMNIPEDDTFLSSNYFDMSSLYLGSDMPIYVVAVLIAIACAAVVYNIFYISVMGKLREYGRLKVIGTTPRQLRQVVKRERRILMWVGIASGLLIAAALSNLLYPGYWNWEKNLRYTVFVIVTAAAIIVFSTQKALRMAGKVSAIEAVRSSAWQEAPGASRRLRRRLTIFRLACMNFTRSRRKTALTVFSLGMTGILTICVASYSSSVDIEEMARSSFGDGGDYTLSIQDRLDFAQLQKEELLGADTRERLLALPDVDFLTSYSAVYCMIAQSPEADARYLIGGYSEEQMMLYEEDDAVLEGTTDYETLLQNDGILVVRDWEDLLKALYHMEPSIGDTVTLQSEEGISKDYTVMGIVNTFRKGAGTMQAFVLPEEELRTLYPDIKDFTGYINIHAAQASERQRQALYTLLEDPRVEIASLTDLVASTETHLRQICLLLYGLVVFISLFALINLINTLLTNLLVRQQEFGIFQSVGMTGRQLSRMISNECLCYVGVTLLITLSIGTGCAAAVVWKFNQMGLFGRLTYHFPVVSMLVFTGALLAVYGVFRLTAVRFLQKRPLIERMKTVDSREQ